MFRSVVTTTKPMLGFLIYNCEWKSHLCLKYDLNVYNITNKYNLCTCSVCQQCYKYIGDDLAHIEQYICLRGLV